MKNKLARLTGILLCLAEIPAKRAVFSRMTAPARLSGLKNQLNMHACHKKQQIIKS